MAKIRSVRAYSKPAILAKLDQRTKEARMMRETRAELVAHVGGAPSAVQRALIEQAVQLRLRLAVMDRKWAAAGAEMTECDSNTYLAWSGHYTRTLAQLGLQPAPPPRRSLMDRLRDAAAPDDAAAIQGPPGPVTRPAPPHPEEG